VLRLFCFFCLIFNLCTAQEYVSPEEALFVRRILEFWKDKENALVKSQVQQFLQQYPSSSYHDSLLVLVGDIFWNEKNYEKALSAYGDIQSKEHKEKVFNNCIDCLFHLKRYQTLSDMILPRISKKPPETNEQALWMYLYAEALLDQAKNAKDPLQVQNFHDMAREYFELLTETEHKLNARLALGEILVSLGNLKQAAENYKQTALLIPEKKGTMLLLAAQLQTKEDPEDALRIYATLLEEKDFSNEAARNKMALMYEMEKYAQIISEAKALMQASSKEQQEIVDYYVGRSHFALNQYKEVIALFEPYIKKPLKDEQQQKALLLALIASAYQLNQLDSLENWGKLYEKKFPDDEAKPRILYLRALAFKNSDHYAAAESLFGRLLKEHPTYEKAESAAFERALALYKQGKWSLSRQAFVAFAKDYPQSPLINTALQYISNASLQALELSEEKDKTLLRKQLLTDLMLVLKHPEGLKSDLKAKYQLKIARTLYDLKNYDEAIVALNAYVKQFPKDPSLYQGHLLLASCYREGKQDLTQFVKHSEKVLFLHADYPDKQKLRLNLFGAYLQLAKNNPKEAESLHEKAADHLYAVAIEDIDNLKQENALWLANRLYLKAKQQGNEFATETIQDPIAKDAAQKAIKVYVYALSKTPELNLETLALEQELFKLGTLYLWLNQPKDAREVFEQLYAQQNSHKEWAWTLPSRTAFALANAHRLEGNAQQALDLYQGLMTQSKPKDHGVASAAKLEWARLSFALLPNEKRNMEDAEMVAILKTLKDLQIKKILNQEPLHLEAAIDYAAFRSAIEPKENQVEQQRFLLLRAKEDFTSRTDLHSKDYYASRKEQPDKDLIYQAYMILIDAQILRLEATLAEQKGAISEVQAKREASKSLYKSLTNGKFAVSKYLVDHAKSETMR